MVRELKKEIKSNVMGGEGDIEMQYILTIDEMLGHGRMLGRVVLPPHSSIGWHVHEGTIEPYFILEGEGIFVDTDHKRIPVKPGDVCVIEDGQGHGLENPTDKDLVVIGCVLYGKGMDK
jgi:mannose-6-phosphate isomerase-like protein (cupin superfamily)